MRFVFPTVALATLLLVGGCSAVPGLEEELSIKPPADCSQEADEAGELVGASAHLRQKHRDHQSPERHGGERSGDRGACGFASVTQ